MPKKRPSLRLVSPDAIGSIRQFQLPQKAVVAWVHVHNHPEDKRLCFLVPADHFTESLSPTDCVSSVESSGEVLALRCGEGVWMDRTEMEAAASIGAIDKWSQRTAYSRVADLVHGPRIVRKVAPPVMSKREMAEWMSAVAHDAAVLSSWIRREKLGSISLSRDAGQLRNLSEPEASAPVHRLRKKPASMMSLAAKSSESTRGRVPLYPWLPGAELAQFEPITIRFGRDQSLTFASSDLGILIWWWMPLSDNTALDLEPPLLSANSCWHSLRSNIVWLLPAQIKGYRVSRISYPLQWPSPRKASIRVLVIMSHESEQCIEVLVRR